MTDELQPDKNPEPAAELVTAPGAAAGGRLPGMAAISLYMLLLAGTVILGVATKNFPPFYLVFPALFIAAGLGLMMLFRWAWALTLAAVLLLTTLFLYQFVTVHSGSAIVQGLLNMVFFFYLVRAEVRQRLR